MEEKATQNETDYIKTLLKQQKLLLEQRNKLLENWSKLVNQQSSLLTTNYNISPEYLNNEQITS